MKVKTKILSKFLKYNINGKDMEIHIIYRISNWKLNHQFILV